MRSDVVDEDVFDCIRNSKEFAYAKNNLILK